MRRYLNLARHTSDYKVCCSRALFVNIAVYLGYAPNAGWPSRAGQQWGKQRHPSRSTSGENRPSIRIPPVNGLHDQLRVLGPPSGAFLRSIPSLVNGKNLTGVISQIPVSDQCTSWRQSARSAGFLVLWAVLDSQGFDCTDRCRCENRAFGPIAKLGAKPVALYAVTRRDIHH